MAVQVAFLLGGSYWNPSEAEWCPAACFDVGFAWPMACFATAPPQRGSGIPPHHLAMWVFLKRRS
jgi:hypothetical protein